MRVVGLGQCSWDYLSVVDSYPTLDSKKEVLHWEEQGGGPVATALVTLSKLGVASRYHGITGDDEAGEKIRQSLVAEKIDVGGLLRREQSSSQVAFIAIHKDSAKRTIFWMRPQGPPLAPHELQEDFLEGANFVLLDGLMIDVSMHAAEAANRRGIPVMLDAGSLREGTLELARRCDYIVGSEAFGKRLGWEGDRLKFQKIIRSKGFKHITVTLGERGSISFVDDRIIEFPAFDVEVADTTGAGDVFHGAYIYGILLEWKLPEILQFASTVAALKCTKIGGRAGIPHLDEVSRFLVARGKRPPAGRPIE